MCRCPNRIAHAHGDRHRSLSVCEGEQRGFVVIKCHTGCDTEDVMRVLGIWWGDLFPDRKLTPEQWSAIERARAQREAQAASEKQRRRDLTSNPPAEAKACLTNGEKQKRDHPAPAEHLCSPKNGSTQHPEPWHPQAKLKLGPRNSEKSTGFPTSRNGFWAHAFLSGGSQGRRAVAPGTPALRTGFTAFPPFSTGFSD
jgi:hypothetical protein